jgi:hypothetical protein
MDHWRYLVSDPVRSSFYARGEIEEEELLIDIRTELESGERSAVLHGADQLRKILAHFFPRYKSVRVSWWFGENLVTFNRALASGATLEAAAQRTVFGHQVALAGFSRALILSLEGSPARYTKVVVSFSRPS